MSDFTAQVPQPSAMSDTALHSLAVPPGRSQLTDYIVAILAAVLALLLRAAIDPLVGPDRFYMLLLFAVVFVSWHSGFGPALVTLLLSLVGMVYFFLEPTRSFGVMGLGDQLATAIFLFCGVFCAALGEGQRRARVATREALALALEQKDALSAEVAARREAEDAARESERRFRLMAQTVPSILWTAAPDGTITWVNDRWLEYCGLTREQNARRWPELVLYPDDYERCVGKWTAALKEGTEYEIEVRNRRHDGEYRWFITRAVPVRDAAGAIRAWFGVTTDIDDRKRAEERLRDSEARFRTLAEAIPSIVWTAAPTGELDYLNPRWFEYTGLTIGASRGRDWLRAVHPDDQGRCAAAWDAATVGTGGVSETELRLRRTDGEYRWFLVRGLRVPSRVSPGRWVGTFTDIHDRKVQTQGLEQLVRQRTADLVAANAMLRGEVEERERAEQQAKAVAVELARSNGELEQFAYIASHDLQEPLRKIQAFGDRLKTKVREALPEVGREYVDRMLSSAGRMRRLIEDLLTFSRVTTQAKPFARIDLTAVANEVVNDLSERIEESEGEVRIPKLPAVEADPTQMRQVFQNLVANALKFRRAGVPPVIEVSAEVVAPPPDDADAIPRCRLTVSDNGIGFDEKYRDRIFQVFQRLHGRNEYEGTGVGLAICRKIVERHGGTITAHSRVGVGTSFIIDLPLRQPPPTEPLTPSG